MGETINPMEWKYPNRDKMIVERREGEPAKERLDRLVKAARYISTLEGHQGAGTLHDYLNEIDTLLGDLTIDELDINKHELTKLRWDAFRREMEGHVSGINRSTIEGDKKLKSPSKLDRVKRLKEVITKLEEWLTKNQQELE